MPKFDPDFLAAATGGSWHAATRPVAPLGGVTQDTRKLQVGDLFVALKTARRDGHDFIKTAREAGAGAALVERVTAESDFPQLVVRDTWQAIGALAAVWRDAFPGTVVGVTGSCGKTTFKDLLRHLLGETTHATEANLNNTLGVPLTLCGLDPMVHAAAVVEAGINQRGEMAQMEAVLRPDIAVVTNVGPVHLEQLGSVEGVAQEKAMLARRAPWAVFPASCLEHEPFQALQGHATIVEAWPADTLAREVVSTDGVSALTLDRCFIKRPMRARFAAEPVGAGQTRIYLQLIGERAHAYDCRAISAGVAETLALALVTARLWGSSASNLQARLREWQASARRGEIFEHGGRWLYVDCYNANPPAMLDALAHFAATAPAEHPRLYVVGGMKELGAASAELHECAGAAIPTRPQDAVLFIGEEAADLRRGFEQSRNAAAWIAACASTAEAAALVEAFAGAVFLKGSRAYALEQLVPAAKKPATGPHPLTRAFAVRHPSLTQRKEAARC